jgi:hypothetical protein
VNDGWFADMEQRMDNEGILDFRFWILDFDSNPLFLFSVGAESCSCPHADAGSMRCNGESGRLMGARARLGPYGRAEKKVCSIPKSKIRNPYGL